MLAWILIGAFIFINLVGFVAGLSYTYKTAFYSDPKKRAELYRALPEDSEDPEIIRRRALVTDIANLPAERVYITSRDGLRLSARYYHAKDGAPIEILCHGYRSMHQRDFGGIHEIGMSLGHNLLMIDQRAHGESDGKTITFGIKESGDAIEWIKYCNERFGEVPILLYGISMGGATVLMAAGEKLPKNVKGVIADCPMSSALEIIKLVSAGMGPGASFAGLLARISARMHGFDLTSNSAEEAVKRAEVPILLLHGDEDDLVPYYMGQRIAAANPEIQFETFECRPHARCYLHHTERYTAIVKDFIVRALSKE
jgi:pimeloyl-ACP methyl ester carboxylesterase